MAYYEYNPQLLSGISRLHFIGVGGSGMYPLVQILVSRGYRISGSDVEETHITEYERELGVRVCIGHSAENLGDAQMIVYSAAIHPDNPEMQAAAARDIPCVERSELLGFVSRLYRSCIGVAGTHGKTTVTSMVTTLFELAGRDPGAVIGGKLPLIGGYGKPGSGSEIVIEACEFSETFLNLAPTHGILLNVDNDHLDYYGSMENLKAAFRRFMLLSERVSYNIDDPNSVEVMQGVDRPARTFGLSEAAQYRGINLSEYKPGFFAFDVLREGQLWGHIALSVPGRHNVYNALAMCSLAEDFGLTAEDCRRAAADFRGAGRRFEIRGECNGAVIVDDYAHHPVELAATLATAKEMCYKRVVAVHLPFTYSRTRNLLHEFAQVLSAADKVVLLPIMGGRERDDGSVKSEDLAALLPGSELVGGLKEAADWVKANCGEGDLVVCMSCGDLYKAADLMVGM